MSLANSGLERWPPTISLVGSWSTRYIGEGIYLQSLVVTGFFKTTRASMDVLEAFFGSKSVSFVVEWWRSVSR